jgi:hypothetical protein
MHFPAQLWVERWSDNFVPSKGIWSSVSGGGIILTFIGVFAAGYCAFGREIELTGLFCNLLC